jgi:hypothetical protein
MAQIDRRDFIKGSAVAGGILAAGASGFDLLVARAAVSAGADHELLRAQAAPGEGGYGPLAPYGAGHLALPPGFQYKLFGVEGDPMSNGQPTPKAHDGMAAFALPNGNIRLIRNHEDRDSAVNATLKGDPAKAYDLKGGGSCTSLEVDPVTRELVKDFIAISGTYVNCAGGPTPWGSWVTCEETTSGAPQGFGKEHGYVFEIPAISETEVVATPLKGLGRFVHEALAVDPATWVTYLTEDRGDSGFYRYLPAATAGGAPTTRGRTRRSASACRCAGWISTTSTRRRRRWIPTPCRSRGWPRAAPSSAAWRAAGGATARSTSSPPAAATPAWARSGSMIPSGAAA